MGFIRGLHKIQRLPFIERMYFPMLDQIPSFYYIPDRARLNDNNTVIPSDVLDSYLQCVMVWKTSVRRTIAPIIQINNDVPVVFPDYIGPMLRDMGVDVVLLPLQFANNKYMLLSLQYKHSERKVYLPLDFDTSDI